MNYLSTAERLLQELGVMEPHEIDIEAIAWHVGARVKYCVLEGCDARIVGYKDKAIIRVQQDASRRRQRFSVAHELGHWRHHRRRLLACAAEDIGSYKPQVSIAEREANSFAADLLLPAYLLRPIAGQYKQLNFRMVREIGQLFTTSVTATAIRLIDLRHSPAMLVCHTPKGRRWFRASKDVPERWFPQDELDNETFAFELLFGKGSEQSHPRLVGADAWFDRDEAQQYELYEHSLRTAADEVLTLLIFKDNKMLEEWGRRR